MHGLLTKIHDILHRAVSKQVADTACIVEYFSNSASRQCCEVWLHSFPFLTTLRTLLHLVKLALRVTSTGTWLRLSNKFHLACSSLQLLWEVAKLILSGFQHNVPKWPVLETTGASITKKPCLGNRTESCPGGRKSSDGTPAYFH